MDLSLSSLEQKDDAWAAAFMRGWEFRAGKHREDITATRVLMQSMLVHEGFECEDEHDAFGLASLMRQVTNLKYVLRSHSAAQNRS